MARRTLQTLGAVLLVALLPACGSTVQVKPGTGDLNALNGGTGGDSGLGTVPGAQGTTGSLGGTTGGFGTTGGTSTGGTGTGGTSGGFGTTGGGSSSSGGFGTSGGTTGGSDGNAPGVTATKVYVGFVYDKNAGAVNQAVGVGGITSGDSKADTNAIVKDINSHGGLGGRELVPVYSNFDSTSAQTLDQQYAAGCQDFTRGNPRVFAVAAGGNSSFKECLNKAGVLILSSDLPSDGEQEMRRWPALIEQGFPNLDRLARYYLQPLIDQKYFTPWDTTTGQPAPAGEVKVGILTYDDPVFKRAVDTILVPGLKRLGYTPVIARIAPLTRAADTGTQGAAVKSAQLTFASNRVTHVIPFESNGGLSTFFLPTAGDQRYYPRYGVYSASAAEALIESGAVDPKQYNGAVGYGWLPAIDQPSNLNKPDGPYSNEARRHCLAVLKNEGIEFDSGNAETIALNICAGLYLLKTVLDKRPAHVTLPGTVNAIQSLGRSYQKAGGLGQNFVPGRQDPLDRGYYWKYFPDCSCMHYYGAIRAIP